MIKLFNTMTKTKQEGTSEIVTMYTCGPTVYLDPHIGNWRTFIFYDTLARALKVAGHDVRHVLNITDVGHLVSDGDTGEDKLSTTAKSQRKTAWEVAEHYTNLFLTELEQLGMLTPTKLPKATDHIRQQIDMVKRIEAKGYTYTIDDGVYFDTAKLDDYGKLAGGVKADEDFARINKNSNKRSPEDFALWKFSPANEKRDMEWDSPWGVGFPGWHLECSAMAKEYLGETIDIHAGGVDHIPVHHTNEIAQSETANGVEFAKIWAHAEFMKVDGAKMSKSKGNFYTLSDIAEQGFSPLDFRYLVLQGHYRTETNFTWDNLRSAQNALRNLKRTYDLVHQTSEEVADQSESIALAQEELLSAILDDLNTPQALSAISSVATMTTNGLGAQSRQTFIEFFQIIDKVFGLQIVKSSQDISDEQKDLIEKREIAKRAKDYTQADSIRDELLEQGLELLDNNDTTRWQRVY